MEKQFKKLTKSGSITIPRLVRKELGIKGGSAVVIETDEDLGVIKITKHIPTCLVCCDVVDVVKLNGTCICKKCAAVALESEVING